MFAEKWHSFTHEPGHIIVIGNIPLSGLVFRSWCPATTLGTTFWVWCDLWRLHFGNSFNILQFIESDNAFDNKLVHSLSCQHPASWISVGLGVCYRIGKVLESNWIPPTMGTLATQPLGTGLCWHFIMRNSRVGTHRLLGVCHLFMWNGKICNVNVW